MIIRPPDIVVGGLRFYHDYISILLSYIFFRQLPSELAEQNSPKSGYMLGSKCDLKMYVQNLRYPLPLKTGGPKPPFFDDFAT